MNDMDQNIDVTVCEMFHMHLSFMRADTITTPRLLEEYNKFDLSSNKNAIPLIDKMIDMGLLKRVRFGLYAIK